MSSDTEQSRHSAYDEGAWRRSRLAEISSIKGQPLGPLACGDQDRGIGFLVLTGRNGFALCDIFNAQGLEAAI
jgi:hypothetical protein